MMQIIAILLALILFVLLFGADTVKSGLGVGLYIALVLSVFLAVAALFFGQVLVFLNGVDRAREKGDAWRWKFLVAGGIVGIIAVYAVAVFDAGTFDLNAVKKSVLSLSYWWLPLAILGLSLVTRIFESAPKWVPAAPEAIRNFFITWAHTLIAPVMAPIGRWTSIKEQRQAGAKIGFFSAAGSLSASFLGGCLACFFGAAPLVAIIAILVEVILKAVAASQ